MTKYMIGGGVPPLDQKRVEKWDGLGVRPVFVDACVKHLKWCELDVWCQQSTIQMIPRRH